MLTQADSMAEGVAWAAMLCCSPVEDMHYHCRHSPAAAGGTPASASQDPSCHASSCCRDGLCNAGSHDSADWTASFAMQALFRWDSQGHTCQVCTCTYRCLAPDSHLRGAIGRHWALHIGGRDGLRGRCLHHTHTCTDTHPRHDVVPCGGAAGAAPEAVAQPPPATECSLAAVCHRTAGP